MKFRIWAAFLIGLYGGVAAWAQSATKNAVTETHPCSDADFWIGEWEVREPDTIKIGNVSVKTHEGHCVLVEEWTWTAPTEDSRRGNAFCLLAYSDERHVWQYDCGTDYGTRYSFADGVRKGDELRFVDKRVATGMVAYFSYIKLPDGRIHEFEQETKDGGKTWETTVNVYWSKRP